MMIVRAAVVVRKLRNVAAASGFLLFAEIATSQPTVPVDAGTAAALVAGNTNQPRFLPRAVLFTSVSHGPSILYSDRPLPNRATASPSLTPFAPSSK